jgi:hypothetical protein
VKLVISMVDVVELVAWVSAGLSVARQASSIADDDAGTARWRRSLFVKPGPTWPERDTKTAIRATAAGVFLVSSGTALVLLARMAGKTIAVPGGAPGFAIEAIEDELFTGDPTPVRAQRRVAPRRRRRRGRCSPRQQVDPTLHLGDGA